MNRVKIFAILLIVTMMACHQAQKGEVVLNQEQIEDATSGLREAYAVFNRGDINAAVRILDPGIEWIEPPEFPGGGTYHGVESTKQYLAHSRASAAQVISEPEQFITAGDRIVVFVHARVLPKRSGTWQDVRLADVCTFQNGQATKMRVRKQRGCPTLGRRNGISETVVIAPEAQITRGNDCWPGGDMIRQCQDISC